MIALRLLERLREKDVCTLTGHRPEDVSLFMESSSLVWLDEETETGKTIAEREYAVRLDVDGIKASQSAVIVFEVLLAGWIAENDPDRGELDNPAFDYDDYEEFLNASVRVAFREKIPLKPGGENGFTIVGKRWQLGEGWDGSAKELGEAEVKPDA